MATTKRAAEPAPPRTLATAVVERSVRSPVSVLAAAALVTVAAAWSASGLELRTSRKALLPHDAEVSRRFDDFLHRFGVAEELIAVVSGADAEARRAFVAELGPRLEARPEVRSVFVRVEPAFLLAHGWTFVPTAAIDAAGRLAAVDFDDGWNVALARATDALETLDASVLADVPDAVADATASAHWWLEEWQRWLDAPSIPPAEIGALPPLPQLAPHAAAIRARGFLTSRDGGMYFAFVRPTDPSEESAVVGPFVDAVRAEARALADAWRASDRTPPDVGLTGLPAVVHEEFTAIRGDIALVVGTAAAAILLLIAVWLRSLPRAVGIFAPMVVGVVWNLALAEPLIGHLTLLTSSFTAILFGLGVDYGIFMSSRVVDALDAPGDRRARIAAGAASAVRPLAVAAGATALVFAALIPAPFPGFSELGIVAATGVVTVVSATVVLQPAIFALWPPGPARVRPEGVSQVPRRLGAPALALGIAAGVGGIAAAGAIPFDYDVLSLLPADSEAAALQRRMVAESDFQAEVAILTADDLPEAHRFAAAAAARPTVARVQSVAAFFPPDATARAAAARRLGATIAGAPWLSLPLDAIPDDGGRALVPLLEAALEWVDDAQEQAFAVGRRAEVAQIEALRAPLEAIARRVATDDGARARTVAFARAHLAIAQTVGRAIAGWRDAAPLRPTDLPDGLRTRFVGADGRLAVYAFPAESVYAPAALDAFMADIYAVDADATGFPATHQVFSRLVVEAFTESTWLAALVALLWIAALMRRPRDVVVAALPLWAGGGAALVAMWASGSVFNYANIVALPLVMGLAIDYGVWFAHESRARPGASGAEVARVARRPILLAAATTLAGLGAISLASYRGVSSLGGAITLGVLCCAAAALVVSPAAHDVLGRSRR